VIIKERGERGKQGDREMWERRKQGDREKSGRGTKGKMATSII
jgi:hypothetical protein